MATLVASPAASPLGGAADLDVELVRDAYGVPHVFAHTDEGALYGLGYAQAEDRLFQMYWIRAAYQGRLAQYFGKGPATETGAWRHVELDRTARLVGWARHARRVADELPGESRRLLEAFARGVNDHVASRPESLNRLFTTHGLPLTEWTPADCIGSWYWLGQHFAGLGLEEAVARAEVDTLLELGWSEQQIQEHLFPPSVYDDGAAVVLRQDVPAYLQAEMARFASEHAVPDQFVGAGELANSFSQALAVNGAKVSTGEAVLLGEPRFGVTAPNTLYEASITGATFAVRGACAPGTANFLSGSTLHNAWSATALGVDQADLFRLVTDDAAQPGKYLLDGEWTAYAPHFVDHLVVKGEPQLDESLLVRGTLFGPVVTALVDDCEPGQHTGPGCLGTTEYALRALPLALGDGDSLLGFVAKYRAENLDELLRAAEGVTWPSMNLVAADVHGSIGFVANGAVPIRAPEAFLGGWVAQEGDALANDWRTYLPHELKPWCTNPERGFVMSANHRPIGQWYPMHGFYPRTGDTHRSRRLREVLEAQPVFTPDELRSIHLDRVQASFRDVVDVAVFLREEQRVSLSPAAGETLQFLAPWRAAGATMDATNGGVAVAQFLRRTLRASWAPPSVPAEYGGGEAGLALFLRVATERAAASQPQYLTGDEVVTIESMLEDAWADSQQATGASTLADMLEWYLTQTLTSTSETELVYGKQLGGNATWDPSVSIAYGPLITAHGDTNLSQKGGSYTQFVRLSDPGLAEAMLALGVSEDPASPHFDDQKVLWERGRLKHSPLGRDRVLLLGATKTVTLSYP